MFQGSRNKGVCSRSPLTEGRRVNGRGHGQGGHLGSGLRDHEQWQRAGQQHGLRAHEGTNIWGGSAGFQAGLCPGDWELGWRLHLGTLDRIPHTKNKVWSLKHSDTRMRIHFWRRTNNSNNNNNTGPLTCGFAGSDTISPLCFLRFQGTAPLQLRPPLRRLRKDQGGRQAALGIEALPLFPPKRAGQLWLAPAGDPGQAGTWESAGQCLVRGPARWFLHCLTPGHPKSG